LSVLLIQLQHHALATRGSISTVPHSI